MSYLKVGDWVIPLESILPIDPERRYKYKKPVQICTTKALQIESIPVEKEDEEQLRFHGVNGQFLACFFKRVNNETGLPKIGDRKQQNIQAIISAHTIEATSINIDVLFEERIYTLLGSKEKVINLSMTTIELLDFASTTGNHITANGATDAFEDAIKRLIKEGSKFYTVLRSSWTLPALSWEICP